MPGLQIESFCVWYEVCGVRGEKNATLQRIRKKYTYEMDKINAENYVKCSKKVLKKCLKVCGKAIHLPRLNDGRVRNREKKCVFLDLKLMFLANFMQNTSTKSNSIVHNLFCNVIDNRCRPVICVTQGV